ncbi:hypothetical protein KK060_22725 [Fulvivirgaceae bacterium PWU20]|uniref:Uncharacterized protein n=1 Tax=Chryseosolibacter indicus TaxID=2782351 RepID=A0ABS5VYW9_9BACT|nr:hypothetical protein [Chryseosolibacter indicus]
MPAPCVQYVCEKQGCFLADMVLAWCSHGAGRIHSQAIREPCYLARMK